MLSDDSDLWDALASSVTRVKKNWSFGSDKAKEKSQPSANAKESTPHGKVAIKRKALFGNEDDRPSSSASKKSQPFSQHPSEPESDSDDGHSAQY